MAQSDLKPTVAPTTNKTVGGLAGGFGGGGAGALLLWLLHAKYGIDPGPEASAVIGGAASTIAAGIATFFVPLITAAQQLALRKLQDETK